VSEVAVISELYGRADKLALRLGYPITFPNDAIFQTPTSGGWLRSTVLNARGESFGMGARDSNQHPGILQIDIFRPTGEGEVPARQVADQVIAEFKRGTKLKGDDVRIEVVDPPFTSQALQEPDWIRLAVSIPFTAFAANPA
jgi:hypothetical protein